MEDLSRVVLVADMDGTLLTDDKSINPVDLKAIEHFRSLGGTFTVATGRNYRSASQYFERLKVDCPVILFNGGMLFDVPNGRAVHVCELHECAERLVSDVLGEFPDVACEILTSREVYVVRNNSYEQEHNDYSRVTPRYCTLEEYTSAVEASGEERIKALFAMHEDTMPRLARYVDSRGYGEYLDFVKSTNHFYEVLPKGCSKGSALRRYKEMLGLRDCIVVAVGDYYNDVDMLKVAHIGVAPHNALESVRRSADFVTNHDNNTGAIAETVDYIVSKYLPY